MKKVLAMALCLCMVLGVFAGCGVEDKEKFPVKAPQMEQELKKKLAEDGKVLVKSELYLSDERQMQSYTVGNVDITLTSWIESEEVYVLAISSKDVEQFILTVTCAEQVIKGKDANINKLIRKLDIKGSGNSEKEINIDGYHYSYGTKDGRKTVVISPSAAK